MSIDFTSSGSSTARATVSYIHASAQNTSERMVHGTRDRLKLLAASSSSARSEVDNLLELAKRGLKRMHKDGAFGHTLRSVRTGSQSTERLEGDSLRYQAMVALGLAYTDEATQNEVLDSGSDSSSTGGPRTAVALAGVAAKRAESSDDPGAVALAAWAAAEAGHFFPATLFARLAERLASDEPIPTVDCAWALTAALAARRLGETSDVIVLARKKLSSGRASSGLFPHMLPASAAGALRSQIGSFADQVYPIQALARLHAALGDTAALSMAEACAERICTLQGSSGQWWWHYDTRSGGVAEGYPVYSVHQHAMAPMVLLDLREAGGTDYMPAIRRGLRWLEVHPEVGTTLVIPEKGVVWRKVARRESKKIVRAIAAVATAISPGLRVPGIDFVFPPSRVDYECRPYELGWLLYAWLSGGVIARLATGERADAAGLSREE